LIVDKFTDRVVVTGSNGFLGKCLVEELTKRGYYAKCLTRGNSGLGDLTSQLNVHYLLDDLTSKDVVIHVAGDVGGIQANQKHPGRFMYNNLAMGMNVIEQCRIKKVKKYIQIGTACSYPDVLPMPFKEDEMWNGYPEPTNAPYGIAKRTLYELVDAYREEYGFNGISVILANLYGPGDSFDPKKSHVIPALIKKIVDGIRITGASKLHVDVWGTGKATRDFLYIDDAVDGIINLMERYCKSGPINIGSGKQVSINEIITTILNRFSVTDYQLDYDSSKPDGQAERVLDISKASVYGWKPNTDFKSGIQETTNYYTGLNEGY